MKALFILPQKQRLLIDMPYFPSHATQGMLERAARKIALKELAKAQGCINIDTNELLVFIDGQTLCFETFMPVLHNLAYKNWLQHVLFKTKPILFKEKS